MSEIESALIEPKDSALLAELESKLLVLCPDDAVRPGPTGG